MWINILVFSCHNRIPALYSVLKPPRHRHGPCGTAHEPPRTYGIVLTVAQGNSCLSLCWFKLTTLCLHHVTFTCYIQRNRNISLFLPRRLVIFKPEQRFTCLSAPLLDFVPVSLSFTFAEMQKPKSLRTWTFFVSRWYNCIDNISYGGKKRVLQISKAPKTCSKKS